MKLFLAGVFLLVSVRFALDINIKSKTPIKDQISAVQGLIGRVLDGDEFVKNFDLRIDTSQENFFEIYASSETNDGVIVLSGQDGVSLSSAFFFYLREFMNSMYTWETKHIDTSSFPLPTKKITKQSMVKYRYMFNVCTFGYTMSMWTFEQWEQLIDWMALHGVNLPLSFAGQEYIWLKTFESFGVSSEEMLDRYFSGPLFLPWNRMGNIKRWGGPLSEHFINEQVALQKQILERQRSLGMIPVLPGYPGFVPDEFTKLYPNVSVTKETPWGSFNQSYTSVYLLDPTDPIFVDIGTTFLRILNETYGPLDGHVYNVDTFNEMQPKYGDETYLKEVSQSIYNSLKNYDSEAIWMLQGWLFYSDKKFWTNERIKAYLSPVPDDKMIILDLYAELHPVWKRTESFFGKPFIWCLLKNFGGRRGFFGNILEFPYAVIQDHENNSSTMVGTGITSEAIFVPPLPYELFSDLFLVGGENNNMENESMVYEWVDFYISRRYGGRWENVTLAWDILIQNVFNYEADTNDLDTVAVFPSFDITYITDIDYIYSVTKGYRLFHTTFIQLDPNSVTDGMVYDYVDLSRQFLSNLINEVYNMIFVRYGERSSEELKSLTDSHLSMITDLDNLLYTTDHFLLGQWIGYAKNKSGSEDESKLFEFNARNQLSLWGPLNAGIDHDYAQKFWQGLVGDYYYNRWNIFFETILAHKHWDHKVEEDYEKNQDNYEVDWEGQSGQYPIEPGMDIFKVGSAVYEKYAITPEERGYTVEKDTEPRLRILEELVETTARDLSSLSYLCDIDPLCFGFTTDGCLFSEKGVEHTKDKDGIDLYIKKS